MTITVSSSKAVAMPTESPQGAVVPYRKNTSFAQDLAKGAIGGVITVYGIMPMDYAKTMRQQQAAQAQRMQEAVKKGMPIPQGKPVVFSKNPFIWWRGAPGFAMLFGPLTAFQNGVKEAGDRVLSKG